MKVISIFISLCFWTVFSYSQITLNDTEIVFTSDQVKLSYSPTDLFSSISIATNKFVDGHKGIKFFFISKPRQKTTIIRIDSIILQTSSNKLVTLNNPYRDTIFYLNDGGLSLTSIHHVDKTKFEFLKENLITTIILIIDKKQVLINLRKKSQLKFKELLNETL